MMKKDNLKKITEPLADFFLNKILSRKLLTLILASIFLISGFIVGSEWTQIVKWYLGVQGGVDLTRTGFNMYNNRNNNFTEDN